MVSRESKQLPREANFLFDSDFTVALAVNDVVGNTSVVDIHDAHAPTDSMALPVMEFQDQGYKIRKIFA